MKRKNISLILVIFIIALTFGHLYYAYHFNFFTNDDSYISFQYCKNFINANGLVFNKGEKVEGYTNFLWILWLSPWFVLFLASLIEPSYIAIVWGIIFSICTMFLIFKYQFKEYPKSLVFSLLTPFFLIIDGTFLYWPISGLENIFTLFLILLGFYYYLKKTNRCYVISGAIFALACMSRMDSIVFILSILIYHIIDLFSSSNNIKLKLIIKAKLLLYILIPFILLFGGYFIWRMLYYDSFLPNTYYLRENSLQFNFELGSKYIVTFIENRLYIIFLVLVGFIIKLNEKNKISLIFLILYSLYVGYEGGDFFPGSRMLFVILPFIYFILADIIVKFYNYIKSSNIIKDVKMSKMLTSVIIIIISLFISNSIVSSNGEFKAFVEPWVKIDSERIEMAKALNHFSKPNESVFAGPIGQIGFYSDLKVYDYWGVIDPHISKSESHTYYKKIAHSKYDFEYLLEKEPTYLTYGIDFSNPIAGYSTYIMHYDEKKIVIAKKSKFILDKFIPISCYDFEENVNSLKDWKIEGDAFKNNPQRHHLPNQDEIIGKQGLYCINSGISGREKTGKLISSVFLITEPYIVCRIANSENLKTELRIIIDDEIVETVSSPTNNVLYYKSIDMKDYINKEARIEIVDEDENGSILVDEICQASLKN